MEDEEQSLLSHQSLTHLSPTASSSSSTFSHPTRQPSQLSQTWRRTQRLNSPVSNFFLYPLFYIVLWTRLVMQSFQGVLYRSSCSVCRKRSGLLEQMVASADKGCGWCAVFVEALETMAPRIEMEVGMFTMASEGWFGRFPLVLRVWNVGGFETARVKFLAPKVCKVGTTTYPGSFEVSGNAASDDCMQFVQDKAESCVKHHKECQKPKRTRLPKRVLDVVDFAPDSDVKLYEPRNKNAKYIALSHTWGKEQTFMTKTSNLEELKTGIKLETLPQTFQDAIAIARKLRIRYLWIDSLCILQDHLPDWEEESPKMGTIYGNAFLTIAAGSALDDEAGFLLRRSDRMYRDLPLETQKLGNCIAITRAQDLSAPDRRDPLSFRAWAFQERLLSRRILYYHQQELIFECKHGLQCECMSCSRVISRYRRDESKYWSRLGVDYVSGSFPRVEIPKPPQRVEDVQAFWRRSIVPEYSARSITRDADRLPALSSVAAAVQALLPGGDAYIAGMWRAGLPAELAWSTVQNARSRTGERVPPTVPVTYVAPSWCWASVNGAVEYKNAESVENIRYRVSVLDVSCTTSSSNPFGSVESGSITLTGMLIYGTCELHVEPDRLWPYRIELLFPVPSLMTMGFEADVAFLSECPTSHVQTLFSVQTDDNSTPDLQNTPQAWLKTTTSLKRSYHSFTDREQQDPSSTYPDLHPQQQQLQQPSSSSIFPSNRRISHGRISCLLLYTTSNRTRSEWVFMVLGESTPRRRYPEGTWERLGLLTCWVNDLAEWEELEGLVPRSVTVI